MTNQTDDSDARSRPKASALGFGTLLRGVRRHPLTTALFVLLSAASAAAIWFFLPLPKMTAYSVFHISAQPQSLIAPVGDAKADFMLYRQAQSALVKSRPVLNTALNQPGMADVALLNRQPDKLGWLESHLAVDFRSSPEFMRLSLEGDEEDDIKAIIAAIKVAYMKEVVNKEESRRANRLSQLDELRRNYEVKLEKFHGQISKWAENLGGTAPEGLAVKEKFMQEALGMAEKELLVLQSEMRKAQVERTVAETKATSAEKLTVPDDVVRAAVKADPGYQKLLARRDEVRQKIDDIKSNLNPGARPAGLVQRETELAAVEKEIDAFIENARPEVALRIKGATVSDGKSKIAVAKDRESTLSELQRSVQSDIEKFSERLKNSNLGQVSLESLKFQMAQTEKMADRVSQEIETIKAERDTPSRVTVWEDPAVMLGIEGYRRLKYTLLTAGGVLLLGLGLITLLESRNRRVQTMNEASSDLGLKLIGTVPTMPRTPGRAYFPGKTRAAVWQSMLIESIDAARMMLVHSLAQHKKGRSLLVTSAMPSEGKTMLACHLASSLARGGFNTLLIDGDTRRPTVHNVLEVPASPGLCELLRGETAPMDAIRTTAVPGLSFLAAGVWDVRIPQTLSTDRWRSLSSQLESAFDFIVIDSPPVLLIADGLQMARSVDGVVMSVLRNVSQIDAVAQARDRLITLGANVLGVVVNGIDTLAYRDASRNAYQPYFRLPASSDAQAPSEPNSQQV